MRRLIELSRYVVAVPAVGSIVGAFILMVIGTWEIVRSLVKLFDTAIPLKESVVSILTAVDTLLLATVLLVIGYGLYELFVDADVQLPPWLEIRSLDDLKAKLIGVVVAIIAVVFLGVLVDATDANDVMLIGIGRGRGRHRPGGLHLRHAQGPRQQASAAVGHGRRPDRSSTRSWRGASAGTVPLGPSPNMPVAGRNGASGSISAQSASSTSGSIASSAPMARARSQPWSPYSAIRKPSSWPARHLHRGMGHRPVEGSGLGEGGQPCRCWPRRRRDGILVLAPTARTRPGRRRDFPRRG